MEKIQKGLDLFAKALKETDSYKGIVEIKYDEKNEKASSCRRAIFRSCYGVRWFPPAASGDAALRPIKRIKFKIQLAVSKQGKCFAATNVRSTRRGGCPHPPGTQIDRI